MNENKFWDEYKLIAVIDKSKNKQIRFARVKKEKVSGIDIREYYKNNEEMLPGKGLVLPTEKIEEFKNAISRI